MKEYEPNERKCPICNKPFIPAGLHMYKVKGKLVCSYNCREKWRKENPVKELHTMKYWG
jgi:hypothetical protein